MLSLTGGMKYVYCEGNVSFHYKWEGLESFIKYVLGENPRSGKAFIFSNLALRVRELPSETADGGEG